MKIEETLTVYLPVDRDLLTSEGRRLITKLTDAKCVNFKIISNQSWLEMVGRYK